MYPIFQHDRMTDYSFLKWAGGKRWLASRLGQIVGTPLTARLVEPFLGSGSVFFAVKPTIALLADSNAELIATFRGVRKDPEGVLEDLSQLQIDKTVFDRMRAQRPRADRDRAVRLIYLNRTAFNGLYRVNQKNEFNVPFGCKPGTKLADLAAITAASKALQAATLRCQDFRETLKEVRTEEDIVYIDPPYTVKHDCNGFRRYNNNIFSWKDQEDLAALAGALAANGAKVIVSNAHHHEVRRLYPSTLFHAAALERATRMAADSLQRGSCMEWLLVSKKLVKSRATLLKRLGD
jgi:DNA adenine methylase